MDPEKIFNVVGILDRCWGWKQDGNIGKSYSASATEAVKWIKLKIMGFDPAEWICDDIAAILTDGEFRFMLALMWLGRGDFESIDDALEFAADWNAKHEFLICCTTKTPIGNYIREGVRKTPTERMEI